VRQKEYGEKDKQFSFPTLPVIYMMSHNVCILPPGSITCCVSIEVDSGDLNSVWKGGSQAC